MRHHTKVREDWSNRFGDMADFRFFKMATAAILDFGNFKFLTVGAVKRVELHHLAKFSSKSAQMRLIYGYFYIFENGGRHHLGFLKFLIFNGRYGQEV